MMALRSNESMVLNEREFDTLCKNSLYYYSLREFHHNASHGDQIDIVLYQPMIDEDHGFVDIVFVKAFLRLACTEVKDIRMLLHFEMFKLVTCLDYFQMDHLFKRFLSFLV